MRTLKVLPVLLALGSPPVLVGQQTASSDPLVGCYRLELGPWSPALHLGNAEYQTPPERIQLRGEVGTQVFERDQTLVRPVIPHGRTPSAYWSRINADSVRITWTNGFAGVQMHLRAASDRLEGTARAFTDVADGTPSPQADVVAGPTPCRGAQP